MTLDPLLFAPLEVQIHAIAAVLSVVIGPMALFRRSRDIWHKRAGYAWVCTMAITALSGFFINTTPIVGPFGPIHLLSVMALWGLIDGMRRILRGDVRGHQEAMRSLYFWGLGIAGIFTFFPGRRLNVALFGEPSWIGFAAIAALIGLGLIWYTRSMRIQQAEV